MIKTCVVCGGDFETCRPHALICSAKCKTEKQRKYGRKHYLENREMYRIRAEERYKNSCDEDREKAYRRLKEWRANNPEKRREIQNKWSAANREKIAKQRMQRRASDPQRARELDRKWANTNRERIRERKAALLAKRASALRFLEQLETKGIGTLL